ASHAQRVRGVARTTHVGVDDGDESVACREVGIAAVLLGTLHRHGGDSGRLQDAGDLLRRALACPLRDPRIEPTARGAPRLERRERRLSAPADGALEALPRRLAHDGDRAPPIVAGAGVDAVWAGVVGVVARLAR